MKIAVRREAVLVKRRTAICATLCEGVGLQIYGFFCQVVRKATIN